MERSLPRPLLMALRKQKYQLVGTHSAVKKCRWLHESLIHNRVCYKEKFYGIKSHRCLQMTPTIAYCTMRCSFCWRIQPDDIGIAWDESRPTRWDDPKSIVGGCFEAQRRILTGYKLHSRVNIGKYQEAVEPKHAAISLVGEPTLYPDLGALVHEFHRCGMTTFIVTNGTMPEALENLAEEPTQLYVSVCAPDEKTFIETCHPQIPNAWQRLNRTLEILPSFKCPTVMRLTLVRDLNLKYPKGYASIAKKADICYIEPKSFMFVGFSRKRLTFNNMPTHEEIRAFAEKLSLETGYKIINESVESRVLLLSRLEKAIKLA